MAAYRCLHSAGFLLTAINCRIEHGTLYCGLVLIPGNMGDFPIALRDIDSGRAIGKIRIPEDYQDCSTATWVQSNRDNVEFEFIPPSQP